ncbi:thiol S-methyltransferase TMT1A-like [Tubulanus polymorphus]|uniref:thiol S-methyltransferase TMT1A-like n=1 Tax=Tubulanus polymorphus TaxID=672921 RepID=UPI003DA4C8FE
MGAIDSDILLKLKNNFLPLGGVVLMVIILAKRRRILHVCRRATGPLVLVFFQSFIFPKKTVHALKRALFDTMRMQTERLGRPLEIVEIGAGTGENFLFFPENSQVTIVEPMEGCQKYIQKNMQTFGKHVTLKAIKVGFGEKMDEILDEGTFDAAVLCEVLCETRDTKKFLEQTYRILKPGGKLYVMQHAPGKKHGMEYRLMSLINPVWKAATTCNMLGDYLPIIKAVGFTDIDMEHLEKPLFSNYWPIIRTRLIGRATK